MLLIFIGFNSKNLLLFVSVMVLATPTAFVASVVNAALRGNLIKKGATINLWPRYIPLFLIRQGHLLTVNQNLQRHNCCLRIDLEQDSPMRR